MRQLIVVLLICLSSQIAAAQTYFVGLYSDQTGVSCELSDASSGVKTVYVIHEGSSSANTVAFQIQAGSGATLSYISFATQFQLTVGDVPTGVAIAYGGCTNLPVVAATVSYFGSGTSSPCSYLRVKPDPRAFNEFIEVVDCYNNVWRALGGRLVVNPDGSCECGADGDTANWGAVKAKFE